MKTGAMAATVLTVLVALAGTVLVARQHGSLPVDEPKPQQPQVDEKRPKIAPSGPYPKAVADETEFDFGVMLFGTRQSHTFVIRNEGTVPLEIHEGGSTCKCTVGKLTAGAVPPGESVKVEVSWKPFAPADHFGQSAIIWTNDPEHRELRFAVTGAIENIVSIVPEHAWEVGLINEEPITVIGWIYSRILDEFKVLEVSSANSHVKGEAIKFGSKELAKFKAKSGWTIKAKILPGVPVGNLSSQLTIKTDIQKKTPETDAGEKTPPTDTQRTVSYTLAVNGFRPGPIRIVPTAGIQWDAKSSTLVLGAFQHEEGRTAKLFVYLGGLKGKSFQVLDTQCDLPFLNVHLDTKNVVRIGGEKRYMLTLRIPPGNSRMSRIDSNPVRIVLKTNHPELPVIRLNIKFVSL